jgi:hypothetical protein
MCCCARSATGRLLSPHVGVSSPGTPTSKYSRRGRDTEPRPNDAVESSAPWPDHDASTQLLAVLLSCCVHPSTRPSPSRPVSFLVGRVTQLPRSIPRNGHQLNLHCWFAAAGTAVYVCARVQQTWGWASGTRCTGAPATTNLHLHRVAGAHAHGPDQTPNLFCF